MLLEVWLAIAFSQHPSSDSSTPAGGAYSVDNRPSYLFCYTFLFSVPGCTVIVCCSTIHSSYVVTDRNLVCTSLFCNVLQYFHTFPLSTVSDRIPCSILIRTYFSLISPFLFRFLLFTSFPNGKTNIILG